MDILDESNDWSLKCLAASNQLLRIGVLSAKIVEIISGHKEVTIYFRREKSETVFKKLLTGTYSQKTESMTLERSEFVSAMNLEVIRRKELQQK